MRGRSALAILLAILLSVPIVGGTNTTTVEDDETEDPCMEDPEQPCVNQTVLYLWSNGQSTHWSHFNWGDSNNVASNEFTREKDSGVIDIDERFTMKPSLNKKLSMAVDGEIRVVLNITAEGDWTNDNDADSACGQNDCEELNITLWSGATQIFRQHYPGLSEGSNSIMFTYRITEEQSLWDKSTANPSLQIEMKLRGNYQQTSLFTATGEPAEFTMGMAGDRSSRVELPIDPESWDEEFQADEEMPVAEESGFLPGFVFMTALATMSLAAVYLPSKDESEDI